MFKNRWSKSTKETSPLIIPQPKEAEAEGGKSPSWHKPGGGFAWQKEVNEAFADLKKENPEAPLKEELQLASKRRKQ